MNPYPELEKRSLPLIEAYQNDLIVHDRKMIEDNPGVPFLHWTKANGCGTWMVLMLPSDALPARDVRVPYLFGTADRRHIARGVPIIADILKKEANKLVLYWNGKALITITGERAHTIANDYYFGLLRQWDNDLENAA